MGIVNFSERRKKLLRFSAFRPNKGLPNTHVPVVACRSAGIWTRGQLTVHGRPAAGGEPANPAQRGTRLEATTDRAFLVSVGPPKPTIKEACLSCRACGREFSVQTMALAAGAPHASSREHGTAQQLIASATARALSRRGSEAVASAGQRPSAFPTRGERHRIAGESFFSWRGLPAPLGDAAMTDRIREFLARNHKDGPRLVVDLDVVRENYWLRPGAARHERVLRRQGKSRAGNSSLLADLGSCFDAASMSESSRRSPPGRRRTGSASATRSRRRRTSPGLCARRPAVRGRLRRRGRKDRARRAGSEGLLPDSMRRRGSGVAAVRKFGCAPEMAARVLERAHGLGLVAHGLSFHVGSQQPNPRMWDRALKTSAAIFRDLAERAFRWR